MKTLYYSADLSYETKVGTQLCARFSSIDFDDAIEWIQMMFEWLTDHSYTMIKAYIHGVSMEVADEKA